MQESNVKNISSPIVSEGKKDLVVLLDNLYLRLHELEGEVTSTQVKKEESQIKISKLIKQIDLLSASNKNMKNEAIIVSLNEFSTVRDQIKKDGMNIEKENLTLEKLNAKISILKKEMELIKNEANKVEKRVASYGKVLDFRKIG